MLSSDSESDSLGDDSSNSEQSSGQSLDTDTEEKDD